MTFEEQLAQVTEVAESPEEALVAVERAKMFVKLFEKLFDTLAPDDDNDLYETFVESYLHEWLEG